MKQRRVVQQGAKAVMFTPPRHSYIDLLLSSAPKTARTGSTPFSRNGERHDWRIRPDVTCRPSGHAVTAAASAHRAHLCRTCSSEPTGSYPAEIYGRSPCCSAKWPRLIGQHGDRVNGGGIMKERTSPASGQRERGHRGPGRLQKSGGGLESALARCKSFRRDQRGAITLETAFALVVVVFTFASMAAIIGNVYEGDRIGRAARAAARAVSFDPGADACAAAHREIGQTRPTATPDRPCGGWDVVVSTGVAPASLASVLDGGVAVSGSDEMVLVQDRKSVV